MKTDLIRKEDAIKAIFNWMDTHKREVIHKQDITDVIMPLPSAEKTGTWIEDRITHRNGCTYRIRRCSECGFSCHYSDEVYGGGYCPNCGARMVDDE